MNPTLVARFPTESAAMLASVRIAANTDVLTDVTFTLSRGWELIAASAEDAAMARAELARFPDTLRS